MKTLRRILTLCTMAVASIILSIPASATYSKASTEFTYGGVRVKVIDRRDMIGRSHSNTYGYAIYENTNNHVVNLNWKCFGVKKGSNKLVLVDSGNFSIKANGTHKEVYNYEHSSRNNDNHKDYSKYVIAIEIAGQDKLDKGASSNFTQDGVKVQVVDQRDLMGKTSSSRNSFGYTIFENTTEKALKVSWTMYGVLSSTQKQVKVDSGVFVLSPKEKRQEVYSYTGSGYNEVSDFKNYVVKIKVTNNSAVPSKITASNVDKYCAQVLSHKRQGNLTQEDYSLAIDVMTFYFDKFIAIYEKGEAAEKRGDDGALDRLYRQNAKIINDFAALGDLLDDADKKGKFNAENRKKFQQLKSHVENSTYGRG